MCINRTCRAVESTKALCSVQTRRLGGQCVSGRRPVWGLEEPVVALSVLRRVHTRGSTDGRKAVGVMSLYRRWSLHLIAITPKLPLLFDELSLRVQDGLDTEGIVMSAVGWSWGRTGKLTERW